MRKLFLVLFLIELGIIILIVNIFNDLIFENIIIFDCILILYMVLIYLRKI